MLRNICLCKMEIDGIGVCSLFFAADFKADTKSERIDKIYVVSWEEYWDINAEIFFTLLFLLESMLDKRAVQVLKNTLHFFQILWKIYNYQIYLDVRISTCKKFTTIRFVWVLEFPLQKLQKLVLFLLMKIQTPKKIWSL